MNGGSQKMKGMLRKSSRIIRIPRDNSQDVEVSKPWKRADELIKLVDEQYWRKYKSGANFAKVKVTLLAPEDYEEEDGLVDVELNVDLYYEPPDPNVGFPGSLSVEGIEVEDHFKFMGKSYRGGIEFPHALIQYVDPSLAKEANMMKRIKKFEAMLIDMIEKQRY